ncbi:microcin [Erwinia sp. AnSW2-5]|uniref:E492 group microcin n=1 Tax=Erwinia sp. AnSW2-5 TaxID=3367692 RepID=UPI00385B066E
MERIANDLLYKIVGAGDANKQLGHDLASSIAWGAGFGAVTGGPGGALIGAGSAAVQTVVQGAINHGPVNVPIPTIPMGPTWNGSGSWSGKAPGFCEMKGLGHGESGC